MPDVVDAPTRSVEPNPVGAAVPEVLRAPGRLLINATPWGQVYLDGDLVGNTPSMLSVAPGLHTVRIVREGFEPHVADIEVASGQQVRLTNIVLKARER